MRLTVLGEMTELLAMSQYELRMRSQNLEDIPKSIEEFSRTDVEFGVEETHFVGRSGRMRVRREVGGETTLVGCAQGSPFMRHVEDRKSVV